VTRPTRPPTLRPLTITTATADPVGHTPDLVHHYRTLDDTPGVLDGQHPIRKWEYAMALRAFATWRALPTKLPLRTSRMRIADVGGASSNFYRALAGVTGATIFSIDPNHTETEASTARVTFAMPVEAAVHELLDPIPSDHREAFRFDVICCISVIEHVPEVELGRFLDAVTALLKQGGLLILSTDYQSTPGVPDRRHYHWMRARIYDSASFPQLLDECYRLGYKSLGASDFTYNGDHVFDYTMIATALVYQPEPLESSQP